MNSNNNNNNNQIDDLIIDYLDKVLDQEGVAKVEKMMQEDENFRNKVLEYKHAISGVVMHERNKISKIINGLSDHKTVDFNTNNPKENKIKLKNSKKIIMENNIKRRSSLRIAASFLFLLAAGAFLYLKNASNPDHSKLFEDHYKKDVAFLVRDIKSVASKTLGTRGVNPKDTATVMINGERITFAEAEEKEKVRAALLMNGLELFKKSDWTNATITLNKYLENYDDNSSDYNTALFYSAKSKLNDGHHLLAVNDYEKFIRQPGIDKEMKFVAEWDRAISYLVVDQSKVKEYLNEISKDGGHKFQSEAKGLLEYLD